MHRPLPWEAPAGNGQPGSPSKQQAADAAQGENVGAFKPPLDSVPPPSAASDDLNDLDVVTTETDHKQEQESQQLPTAAVNASAPAAESEQGRAVKEESMPAPASMEACAQPQATAGTGDARAGEASTAVEPAVPASIAAGPVAHDAGAEVLNSAVALVQPVQGEAPAAPAANGELQAAPAEANSFRQDL